MILIAFLEHRYRYFDIISHTEKGPTVTKWHGYNKRINKWYAREGANDREKEVVCERCENFEWFWLGNQLQTDKGLDLVVISNVLGYNADNNDTNVQIIKGWTVVSIIY